MSFFELTSPTTMLSKAKRELERLEAEESVDHVFNLFTTLYHVADYLKPYVSEGDISTLKSEPNMKLCADVCNKAKHMKLERSRADISTYANSGAIGGAAINAIPLNGAGERWVLWEDGTKIEVVQFAKTVIERFEKFFAKHGIV